MAPGFHDLDILHTDGTHMGRNPISTSPNIGIVIALRADAWYRKELFQFAQVALLVRIDKRENLLHGVIPFV
jgi:hypothetical protein